MSLFKKIFIITITALFISCESEEVNQNVLVQTSAIVYTSSESAIVQGSLLRLGSNESAEDIGFEISLNEDLSDSRLVSLGERASLGRFIAEIKNLIPDNTYFVRAYVRNGESISFGEILSFETLIPRILSFSPSTAQIGDEISIFGENIPDSISIFFGETRAQVQDVLFQTQVNVRVPKTDGEIKVPIRIEFGDLSVTFKEDFEYVTGTYGQVREFPEYYFRFTGVTLVPTNYFETFGFQQGVELVFGLGREYYNAQTEDNQFVYSYNMESDAWQQTYIPDTAYVPFALNNKFGGGQYNDRTQGFNNEVWQYENGNIVPIDPFPFDIFHGVGVELNGTEYIMGGMTQVAGTSVFTTPRKDLYRPLSPIYRKEGSQWVLTTETVKGVSSLEAQLPNFVINDIAYFMGMDGDLWSFDESTFTWEFKSNYPGRMGYNGVCAVLDGLVYIGLLSGAQDMWAYNPVENTWTPKNEFPIRNGGDVLASGVFNDRVFFIKNGLQINSASPADVRAVEVWVLNPNAL